MMMSKKIYLLLLASLLLIPQIVYTDDMTIEAKAFRGQILSMAKEGRYDEVLAGLRELFNLYPSDQEVSKSYLDALFATNNLQEAKENLDIIFANNVNSREYYEFKVQILEAEHDYLAAAKIYKYMYESRISEDDDLFWIIGERFSWSGDNKNAIKYFELYAAKHKLSVERKLLMADVLFWAMEYDKAVLKYQSVKSEVFKDEKKSLQYCQGYSQVDKMAASTECMQASNAWPQNIEIKAQYAYLLEELGEIEKAEKVFDELASLNPMDLKLQEDAIRVLASVGKFNRAKELAQRVLSNNPRYEPIRLWYARILSWNREYDFSVDQYDILISQNMDKKEYFVEKARVLSWQRKYLNSEKAYEDANMRFRNEAIRLEAAANYDKNRYYYRWAKLNLDALRKLDPQNSMAKVESALLYSELGLWDKASLMYQNILKDNPQMAIAQQAYDKNRIYSSKFQMEFGATLYETDSTSRFADVYYYDVYSKIRAPIAKRAYIYHIISDRFYRFPSLKSRVNRYRQDLGMQLYFRPHLWMDMAYAYADKSDKIESSHYAHFDIHLEHFEPFAIDLKYQRDDVVENVVTLQRHLQKDDYRVRVRLDKEKRYFVGADYTYSNYTDGNEKNLYGADFNYHFSYEPRRLTIRYRVESYGFKYPRNWYFAPNSFQSHGPGLEWRHYLDGEEMHWGSNDTYYTIRYGMELDSSDNHAHKLYFDFHKDWTDVLSTHFEYEHILFEHKDVYEQRGIRFYIRWYW